MSQRSEGEVPAAGRSAVRLVGVLLGALLLAFIGWSLVGTGGRQGPAPSAETAGASGVYQQLRRPFSESGSGVLPTRDLRPARRLAPSEPAPER